MADLEKRDDRKDWLRWAIELLRRGVWAGDIITVHGPHPGASCMWGETEGQLDVGAGWYGTPFATVEFRTVSGIRGIYDVRGVTVRNRDTREKLALLRASELSPKARRWMAVAQPLCKKLTDSAVADAMEAREQRKRFRVKPEQEKAPL